MISFKLFPVSLFFFLMRFDETKKIAEKTIKKDITIKGLNL